MATLIDPERVKYLCSCKRLKPISSLYFCKYCKPLALKCKQCVLHEIDQKYFCANCFDNKTYNEASDSKFKCMNCFACPLCKNSLMMRASSGTAAQKAALKAAALAAEQNKLLQVQSEVTSGQPLPSKVYYLMCSFCRWTTRDVAIPDVTSIPGNWRQPENPNAKRVRELLNAYKVIAAREKIEKDRKKYATAVPKRRTFHLTTTSAIVDTFRSGSSSSNVSSGLNSSDKYGILSPASRRLKNISQANNGGIEYGHESFEAQMKAILTPASTVDCFEQMVPEDFFVNTNVNAMTTISQRHANPEWQPSRSINLYPLNKSYVNKESKRCNSCEHSILKPESNITSIRFKLHQMALFILPDIRIVTVPEWEVNKPSQVILTLSNKGETDMTVELLPLNVDFTNLSDLEQNAEVILDENSTKPFVIQCQDSVRVQGSSLKATDVATNEFVCFRRENKVGICLTVRPRMIEPQGGCVRVAFGLRNCVEQKATASETSVSGKTLGSVVQTVFLDFGELRKIEKPKYIEECRS